MNIQPTNQNQQPNFGITPIYVGQSPARARVGFQTFLFECTTPLMRRQILQEMEQNNSRLQVSFDHSYLLKWRLPGKYNSIDNGKGFLADLKHRYNCQGQSFLEFLRKLRKSAQPKITGTEVKSKPAKPKRTGAKVKPEPVQPKMTDAEVKDRLTKHLGLKPSKKYQTLCFDENPSLRSS